MMPTMTSHIIELPQLWVENCSKFNKARCVHSASSMLLLVEHTISRSSAHACAKSRTKDSCKRAAQLRFIFTHQAMVRQVGPLKCSLAHNSGI